MQAQWHTFPTRDDVKMDMRDGLASGKIARRELRARYADVTTTHDKLS